MAERTDRRDFLSKTLLGAAGIAGACSCEEQILLAAENGVAVEGAAPRTEMNPDDMPQGKIGNVRISRLLIGGNLIGGWAHARDLMYVSTLLKAYNTEAKVFETLELAEQCGVNTIQNDPACNAVIEKYRRDRGGKIQTMVCIRPQADEAKMAEHIKIMIDQGATLLYTHGAVTDNLTMTQKVDVLGKAIDMMKEQGVPGGIGSHSLETPMACEENNLQPDYYVKTFHPDRYWSATPEENREEWCWYKGHSPEHGQYHDNIWCLDSQRCADFMAKVDKPWVAFKTLAAGAIRPNVAFSYAFRNGADFIIAGMFDFQVEQDAKIAIDVLGKLNERPRPWRA